MGDLTVYSDEELKRIQKIEGDALQCVIGLCEKMNIEYFLIGGTALGSVRHGDFIPWDDDIDIGMTRENYVRFLKEAPSLLPRNYHLQTPYGKQENPYFYSKVRIDETKFVEYCNRNLDIHHGVYIDIFPFDEVPDDEIKNKKQFDTVQKWIRVFSLRQSPDVSMPPNNTRDRLKARLRKIFHFVMQAIPYDYLVQKIDCIMTQYNETGQSALACLNFPIRKTEYIMKNDLYPLSEHVFGKLRVNIPGNYDQYLKNHYGDYMQLPSTEQRFGHKPYCVTLGHSVDEKMIESTSSQEGNQLKKENEKNSRLKRVITYGTFDLLNYGHINLLKRAKDLGDYLIVAISTDEFNWKEKQKRCYFTYEQRKALVEVIRYVDLVIPEVCWEQKRTDICKHHINTVAIGEEWKGKFDFLKDEGVEVVYFSRTPEISSTQIKSDLHSVGEDYEKVM